MRAAVTVSIVAGAALVSGCAAPASDVFQPVTPYASQQPAFAPPSNPWATPPYQWGRASFYSDRLAGRATAMGEPYDPGAFTAAHRTLPLGSFVHVARTDGRTVVVRINDRGPYAGGRVIDLSRRAATEIGMVREGVVDVVLRVLWVPPAKPRRL